MKTNNPINTIEKDGIVIELDEINGKTIVNIKSDTSVSITFNDKIILESSSALNDNFQKIDAPYYLLDYLQGKTAYIDETPDNYGIDIYKGNNPEATFFISKDKSEPLVIRTDFITSFSDLEESLRNHNIQEEKIQTMLLPLKKVADNIANICRKHGYTWTFSHPVKEWVYAWYDITLPMHEFDIVKFEEIWDSVALFDDLLKAVYDYIYS